MFLALCKEKKKNQIVCEGYQEILSYYKLNMSIWVVVKTRKYNLSLPE